MLGGEFLDVSFSHDLHMALRNTVNVMYQALMYIFCMHLIYLQKESKVHNFTLRIIDVALKVPHMHILG